MMKPKHQSSSLLIVKKANSNNNSNTEENKNFVTQIQIIPEENQKHFVSHTNLQNRQRHHYFLCNNNSNYKKNIIICDNNIKKKFSNLYSNNFIRVDSATTALLSSRYDCCCGLELKVTIFLVIISYVI